MVVQVVQAINCNFSPLWLFIGGFFKNYEKNILCNSGTLGAGVASVPLWKKAARGVSLKIEVMKMLCNLSIYLSRQPRAGFRVLMVLVKKAAGGSSRSDPASRYRVSSVVIEAQTDKDMTSYCSTRRLRALGRGLLAYLPQTFSKGLGVHHGGRPGQALHWKLRAGGSSGVHGGGRGLLPAGGRVETNQCSREFFIRNNFLLFVALVCRWRCGKILKKTKGTVEHGGGVCHVTQAPPPAYKLFPYSHFYEICKFFLKNNRTGGPKYENWVYFWRVIILF